MKKSKNFVVLSLMTSSIVLLIVLQSLWLRSAYISAEEDFRRETNILFRSTLFAMHDTLIQQNIEPLKDTTKGKFIARRFHVTDTPLEDVVSTFDTLVTRKSKQERTSRVEIFVSGDQDSVSAYLPPIIAKLRHSKAQKSFIIRLDNDTLARDSIQAQFGETLQKAGIETPFHVYTLRDDQTRKALTRKKGTITSEVVRLAPEQRYVVNYTNINSVLLKKIAPQILFSVFLSLLTAISFYVMYRNIRSQQRLVAMKNDFISNITHELKTPIATVSVALEALKNFKALADPQRTTEYLSIAQSELDRLSLMTDKILKTAVFESKGVEFSPETFSMNDLIQQVLASMKLVFEKRKMKILYQKEGMDFTMQGGSTHITNVLYNLLDNALKYSNDGASINISLVDLQQHLILKISDTGIGIPEEYQKKIFEKFFRVPSGDVHNTKGYGLGLSYVSSVVHSHQGTIEVNSKPGEGSTFIITFPKQYED